jgi:ribose 5-phosphate isomerase A
MTDDSKRRVGEAALELVSSGMTLGLGTGSTAYWFLRGLGERLQDGRLRDVTGVPTSRATEATCRDWAIPMVDLPAGGVDLAVDGMDEVTPSLDAIKGLGGALLREKIVAEAAATFVLIGDDRKQVSRLGERSPIPVEVVPFGVARTERLLSELGLKPVLRGGPLEPQLTDNGNPVLDCWSEGPFDGGALDAALHAIPGVVEHGLFIGMASVALVASGGDVVRLDRTA